MKKTFLILVAGLLSIGITIDANAFSGIRTTEDWMRLENNPYNYGKEETVKKLGEFGEVLVKANEFVEEVLADSKEFVEKI